MKTHSSSLDRTSMLITAGVAVLAVYMIYKATIAYRHSEGSGLELIYTSLLGILPLVLIIATYLYRTTAITIDNTGIIVERNISPVAINYSDITSVMPLTKADMGLVARTFGNGGLFGYTGMFYNKKYGSMKWYCTNRSNYVLIEKANGKKAVISPDEPGEFIKDIKEASPSLKIIYPQSGG